MEKILCKKETQILLVRLLEEGVVEENKLVKELQEKTKTKRATAYKIIKEWVQNDLLDVEEKKGQKKKTVRIKYGRKKILKDLLEEMKKTEKILKKIEQKKGKKKDERRDKICEITEEVSREEGIDKGSVVARSSEGKKSRNSKDLQGKRLDRNKRKRKTKTTTNTFEKRWSELRKGKIEEKYTKKQKKILSGIL